MTRIVWVCPEPGCKNIHYENNEYVVCFCMGHGRRMVMELREVEELSD